MPDSVRLSFLSKVFKLVIFYPLVSLEVAKSIIMTSIVIYCLFIKIIRKYTYFKNISVIFVILLCNCRNFIPVKETLCEFLNKYRSDRIFKCFSRASAAKSFHSSVIGANIFTFRDTRYDTPTEKQYKLRSYIRRASSAATIYQLFRLFRCPTSFAFPAREKQFFDRSVFDSFLVDSRRNGTVLSDAYEFD